MFRRRREESGQQPAEQDTPDLADESTDPDPDGLAESADPDAGDGAAPGPADQPAVRSYDAGPWDRDEVEEVADLLDLGGLLVRGVDGMQLQLQVEESTGQVSIVHVIVGDTVLQLQPFAAPRTEGIWAEVRAEIASNVTAQGGTCEELTGPFGAELRAQVPVAQPDGRSAYQTVRFLGVDGPRWFLRGLISGAGALDEAKASVVERVFADVVVVRGPDPMAPRTPIPMRVPQQPGAEPEQSGAEPGSSRPPLEPFQRGPEITEVR